MRICLQMSFIFDPDPGLILFELLLTQILSSN